MGKLAISHGPFSIAIFDVTRGYQSMIFSPVYYHSMIGEMKGLFTIGYRSFASGLPEAIDVPLYIAVLWVWFGMIDSKNN